MTTTYCKNIAIGSDLTIQGNILLSSSTKKLAINESSTFLAVMNTNTINDNNSINCNTLSAGTIICSDISCNSLISPTLNNSTLSSSTINADTVISTNTSTNFITLPTSGYTPSSTQKGYYISVAPSATNRQLTNATIFNIGSTTLTPGTWFVNYFSAIGHVITSINTTITRVDFGLSTSATTLLSPMTVAGNIIINSTSNNMYSINNNQIINVLSTTTYYFNVRPYFNNTNLYVLGTVSGSGRIWAIRLS